MAKAKRVGMLLMGVLLGAGLWQIGTQASSVGPERFRFPAEVQPYGKAEELRSRMEQPATILSIVASGSTVRKGDLLVELDASGLVDKRIQQILDTHKAGSEMTVARDSQEADQRAAAGQIVLAEKALQLAQAQLKAFVEGEYPIQLAEAQAETALAKGRVALIETRLNQVRSESPTMAELREAELALMEARARSNVAESRLALLQKSIRDNKIAELELAVAQREFDLARARDALSSATLRGKQAVSLAEMSCQTESNRLARIDDQIGQSKIYAPRDGTVVYPDSTDEMTLKPGVTVNERQVLLRLLPVKP